MNDDAVADVLAKLQLLEERVAELAHKPLAPFQLDPSDPVDLQDAARRLASHVGLGDLTFIVAVAKQSENVGGHVEIRYAQREVFVELDAELVRWPTTALTALAHEITHKLLHHHQVWLESELDNERLTDIAAIYAGFGAIMLNGCEASEVERYADGSSRRHSIKGGYLDRAELGLAFAALEYLRPGGNGRQHLEIEAEQAVTFAERKLAGLWPSGELGDAAEQVRESVRAEQAVLAAIAKDVSYLRDHALPALEAMGAESHRRLAEVLGEVRALADGEPGRVSSLRAAGLQLARERARKSAARGSDLARLRKQTRKAIAALEAHGALPDRSREMFRLVRCPIDGAKLRIPPDKRRVAVRCPKCGYQFIADSTLDDPEVAVKKKKKGWFR